MSIMRFWFKRMCAYKIIGWVFSGLIKLIKLLVKLQRRGIEYVEHKQVDEVTILPLLMILRRANIQLPFMLTESYIL